MRLWCAFPLLILGTACGPPPRAASEPPRAAPQAPSAAEHADAECEWVHLPTVILFPRGGVVLDAQGRDTLRGVFPTPHRNYAREIRVEGHFDGCEGMDDGDPIAVSRRRAEHTAEALREMGWEREVSIVAYGSDHPRSRCSRHELGYPMNRRVEFSARVCP